MAKLQRIPTTHEALFPAPLLFMGLAPMIDFEASKDAKTDVQQRDKESGLPLWACSVMDMDPAQPAGQRELKVRIASAVEPVCPEVGTPVRFEGLECVPWLNDNGRRPKVAVSIRASGLVAQNGKAGK